MLVLPHFDGDSANYLNACDKLPQKVFIVVKTQKLIHTVTKLPCSSHNEHKTIKWDNANHQLLIIEHCALW